MTELHYLLTQELVKNGATEFGFRRTVIKTCNAAYWKHIGRDQHGAGIVPDAFDIRPGSNEEWFAFLVTAYEVEVGHPVSLRRVEQYSSLFWILDQDFIALELVVINRFNKNKRFSWAQLRDW